MGKLRETGLYYYGARYYDPSISIFLSVDPLAEETMTPYAYAYQNPVRFIDPTGMKGEDWYRDGSGNYVYDSNVNANSKLCDGCTYLGESYNIEINGQEDVQLNADGSSTQGESTSFGMEVDYGWKSGNKVYTGTGGSENSGNAYQNAMNNTTGSANDFGDYSLARKGWNFGADNFISSAIETAQIVGFSFYGLGVFATELVTTGKVPTGHRNVTFTKWSFRNGSLTSRSFSEPVDDVTAFNEFVKPVVNGLTIPISTGINTGLGRSIDMGVNMATKTGIKKTVLGITNPNQ